jgi:uncharacterized repeat protein (TIGR04138 family)
MQESSFEEIIDRIVQTDPRFQRDAYQFVREALDFTQKKLVKTPRNEPRHVTGQELLNGIRECALAQFGPMTLMVLNEWGVNRCEDFGEIVFNMVESGLLAKTKRDDRADFRTGYDFKEAFQLPYLPATKLTLPQSSSVQTARGSTSKPTKA